MALQQTLKNLCSNSGWCYAVFWKVKRRSRMVLTWEDVYYELESSDSVTNSRCSDAGGNRLRHGASLHDTSHSQCQIGLAVAKMSYCVYFMGEGIIGRVAFTGKHQWVFADAERSSLGTTFGNALNNQRILEKYPSSWEVQFAAGIKTIAVIAVQQGVVQLGSTQMIPESVEWVGHVKSAFGALKSAQGAAVASEGQGVSLSTGLSRAIPSMSSSQRASDVPDAGVQSLVYGANPTMCTAVQSNSKGVPSLMESLRPLHSEAQKGDVVQAFIADMRLTGSGSSARSSETIATVPDVVRISNSQAFAAYEDVKQDVHQGNIRNFHPSKGIDSRLWSVGALGRELRSRMDVNLSTDFDEQPERSRVFSQSTILGSGSCLPLNYTGEQSQVIDTGVATVGPNVNMIMPEIARVLSSLGDGAAGCHGAYVGKSGEVLADPVAGNMSHKTSLDEVKCMPCSADPMSISECSGDEMINHGGLDVFETCLSSFTQLRSGNRDCSFGLGDELSQALGPCFYRNHSEEGNPTNSDEHIIVPSDQHISGKMCPLSDPSAAKLMPAWSPCLVKSEPQYSESKSESLLDAVVASASSSHLSISTAVDDSLSCRTFSAKDDESSAPKVLKTAYVKHVSSHCSQNVMSQSMLHVISVDCEASVSNEGFSNGLRDLHSFNMSATCPPLKTILSSWTEDIQSMKSDSTQTSQLKKSDDLVNKATRKRARPGESSRPRPKDRQQIQDRVRELREIVPNGSKCSIDALLEKTIKHMLFLQNVTIHADNLKKNGELKDDIESGASWALELGGEDTGRPPILVKNLNQPRQFLVEMFCEEKSHFLEIADIIRNLGLTILKGVMESRSDKIWARFVVEANRDIRRVDIMMPLMHLLHVNNNSGSSMTIGSQTAPLRSHLGVECSSSSQSQSPGGFPQQPSSLHV